MLIFPSNLLGLSSSSKSPALKTKEEILRAEVLTSSPIPDNRVALKSEERYCVGKNTLLIPLLGITVVSTTVAEAL